MLEPTPAQETMTATTQEQKERKSFDVLGQLPNIYIPMLFSNINEDRLRQIISSLDIFTAGKISFEEKSDSKNKKCNGVFIEVNAWHNTHHGVYVRSKLLGDEEVKVVFQDPWFFIMKRKHEEGEAETKESNSPASPKNDSAMQIANVPKNVKGVSRTPSPSSDKTDPNYCPECEAGIENQMGHTCIWRMMEEGESSTSSSCCSPSLEEEA